MASIRYDSITAPEAPDAVFSAALGVVQNEKRATLLAAHNGGAGSSPETSRTDS